MNLKNRTRGLTRDFGEVYRASHCGQNLKFTGLQKHELVFKLIGAGGHTVDSKLPVRSQLYEIVFTRGKPRIAVWVQEPRRLRRRR